MPYEFHPARERERPSGPCRALFLGLVLFTGLLSFLASPSPALSDGLSPSLNQGRTWRVAYYEGGPWPDYQSTVLGLVRGLMDLGWIEPQPIPEFEDPSDMESVWRWLSGTARSDYLSFPEDGFYSAGWEDGLRTVNKEEMLARLAGGEFDIVLALGTWAGLDLANGLHSVPTMVMSTSNPVTAGIISDPEDSGHDHVHVPNDPTRVYRQILLFHDIFAFARLGVIYEDTSYGRAYAYLDEVEQAARDRGFTLATCQAPNNEGGIDPSESMTSYLACVERLAPKIDAFLYDDHSGAGPEQVPLSLPLLATHGVPTWSTRGRELVERGVLMSIAQKDFTALGEFYAETFANILNGATPRDLEQVFHASFRLAINLETAKLIGFKPPINLLAVTDDVFETIEPPLEMDDGR